MMDFMDQKHIMKKYLISLILLFISSPLVAQPTPDELPNWWVITNPTALNIGYPEVISCAISGAKTIRIKFWLPLGTNEPSPEQILDPVWGDIRLHTAWNEFWATSYGGNHVDVIGELVFQDQAYHLLWTLDIPVDTSDLYNFPAYSARFINTWVDIEFFPGMERIFIISKQCRITEPFYLGVPRNNLPLDPPIFPTTPCN